MVHRPLEGRLVRLRAREPADEELADVVTPPLARLLLLETAGLIDLLRAHVAVLERVLHEDVVEVDEHALPRPERPAPQLITALGA